MLLLLMELIASNAAAMPVPLPLPVAMPASATSIKSAPHARVDSPRVTPMRARQEGLERQTATRDTVTREDQTPLPHDLQDAELRKAKQALRMAADKAMDLKKIHAGGYTVTLRRQSGGWEPVKSEPRLSIGGYYNPFAHGLPLRYDDDHTLSVMFEDSSDGDEDEEQQGFGEQRRNHNRHRHNRHHHSGQREHEHQHDALLHERRDWPYSGFLRSHEQSRLSGACS